MNPGNSHAFISGGHSWNWDLPAACCCRRRPPAVCWRGHARRPPPCAGAFAAACCLLFFLPPLPKEHAARLRYAAGARCFLPFCWAELTSYLSGMVQNLYRTLLLFLHAAITISRALLVLPFACLPAARARAPGRGMGHLGGAIFSCCLSRSFPRPSGGRGHCLPVTGQPSIQPSLGLLIFSLGQAARGVPWNGAVAAAAAAANACCSWEGHLQHFCQAGGAAAPGTWAYMKTGGVDGRADRPDRSLGSPPFQTVRVPPACLPCLLPPCRRYLPLPCLRCCCCLPPAARWAVRLALALPVTYTCARARALRGGRTRGRARALEDRVLVVRWIFSLLRARAARAFLRVFPFALCRACCLLAPGNFVDPSLLGIFSLVSRELHSFSICLLSRWACRVHLLYRPVASWKMLLNVTALYRYTGRGRSCTSSGMDCTWAHLPRARLQEVQKSDRTYMDRPPILCRDLGQFSSRSAVGYVVVFRLCQRALLLLLCCRCRNRRCCWVLYFCAPPPSGGHLPATCSSCQQRFPPAKTDACHAPPYAVAVNVVRA